MFSEIGQLITLARKYGKYLPLVVKLVGDIEAEAAKNSEPNIEAIVTDFIGGIPAIDPNFPTGDLVDIQADIHKLVTDLVAKKPAA